MKKPPQRPKMRLRPWQSITAKWGVSDVFDLYGDDSLYSVLLRLEQREYVSPEEFGRVLQANADQPIPPTLLRTIRSHLKRQGRRRRGRPEYGYDIQQARVLLARILYHRYLKWLQSRMTRPYGLTGWSCIQHAPWWKGPPHERAARMVTRRMFRRDNVDWPYVRNLISSRR